jgi:hypothetical protein
MSINITRDEENVKKTDTAFRIYFEGDTVLDGGANVRSFRLPGENGWVFTHGGINFSSDPSAPIFTPIYLQTGQGTAHQLGSLAGDGTSASNFYLPTSEIFLLPGDLIYVTVATDLAVPEYTDGATFRGFLSFRGEN